MNIENLLDLKNLDNNPILRTLIVNYMAQMYEPATEITDDEIMQELRFLVTHNRLNEIFITEFQSNYAREYYN